MVIVGVFTPAGATAELILATEDMGLPNGPENSLVVQLQNAQDALEAPNGDYRSDAINKLYAFINAVEAQRGNTLTDEQADLLISAASNIISALN